MNTAALLPLLAAFTLPAFASDLEREERLKHEVVDFILDGEALDLQAGGHGFLGLFTPAEGERRGGVILLHGRGLHPAWADVIEPLRTSLPKQGWDTLSLQMPVLEKAAKYNDYVPIFPESFPRIEAGIRFLRERGVKHIVLVAHSCGGHMAMHWLEKAGDTGIAAFAGLGMGATDYKQPMVGPFHYERLKVPVLDVYGAQEYPQVLEMAPERLAGMKKGGNPQSRQVLIPGADHYFHDNNREVVDTVSNWMNGLKFSD